MDGCFIVVISLFYLVGFALLAGALWNTRHSLQAGSWPTAPAKITRLEVRENSDSDGSTYQVEVEYSYVVDGRPYDGKQLAFGYNATSGREAHDEICRKLQGAKQVFVRYDPANPARSCLSYGLHRSLQILLAFAVTWLAFIVGMTLLWWLFSRSDTVLLDNLMVQ
jgi:hypothetical protein